MPPFEAPRGAIPDAVGQPVPAATHPRVRVRVPPLPASRVPALGAATRDAVDERQAQAARSLSQALRPGVTLRLERVRPTWCMGWVLDYPVSEGDSLSELRELVRDEFGGQSYRAYVLGPGDVVLFEGKLDIAAPPKDGGRNINRLKWEGRDEPTTEKQSHAGDELGGLSGFLKLFMDQQRATSDAQLESVKSMVTSTHEQTTALMRSVVDARGAESKQRSFGEQLGELVDATRGIEKARKQLFGAARERDAGAEGGTDLERVEREAKTAFMQAVVGHFVRPGAAPQNGARPQQQRPASAPQRRMNVPDSVPIGHGQPKN